MTVIVGCLVGEGWATVAVAKAVGSGVGSMIDAAVAGGDRDVWVGGGSPVSSRCSSTNPVESIGTSELAMLSCGPAMFLASMTRTITKAPAINGIKPPAISTQRRR